jgi:hypothetical protein
MTPEEFASGVDALLASGLRGHAAHRALDLLWTDYALAQGGPLAEATHKWMNAIEGQHVEGQAYPLGVGENEYTHRFVVRCPNNQDRIHYALTVRTLETIMVEDLVAACTSDPAYHEDLADRLHARFGGSQELRAFHHGVAIRTVRGA